MGAGGGTDCAGELTVRTGFGDVVVVITTFVRIQSPVTTLRVSLMALIVTVVVVYLIAVVTGFAPLYVSITTDRGGDSAFALDTAMFTCTLVVRRADRRGVAPSAAPAGSWKNGDAKKNHEGKKSPRECMTMERDYGRCVVEHVGVPLR